MIVRVIVALDTVAHFNRVRNNVGKADRMESSRQVVTEETASERRPYKNSTILHDSRSVPNWELCCSLVFNPIPILIRWV